MSNKPRSSEDQTGSSTRECNYDRPAPTPTYCVRCAEAAGHMLEKLGPPKLVAQIFAVDQARIGEWSAGKSAITRRTWMAVYLAVVIMTRRAPDEPRQCKMCGRKRWPAAND